MNSQARVQPWVGMLHRNIRTMQVSRTAAAAVCECDKHHNSEVPNPRYSIDTRRRRGVSFGFVLAERPARSRFNGEERRQSRLVYKSTFLNNDAENKGCHDNNLCSAQTARCSVVPPVLWLVYVVARATARNGPEDERGAPFSFHSVARNGTLVQRPWRCGFLDRHLTDEREALRWGSIRAERRRRDFGVLV